MELEQKLIEGNFPCREVGAETKRERGASSMLPPVYYLHVYWARRPLTASRGAVLGSILSNNVSPNEFLKQLGIEKKQVTIGNVAWNIVGNNLKLIKETNGEEYIVTDEKFFTALENENIRRKKIREALQNVQFSDPSFATEIIDQWIEDNKEIIAPAVLNTHIHVNTVAANPAVVNDRIDFVANDKTKKILGYEIKIDPEDSYGYTRAYQNPISCNYNNITVLDPTAGGGSIPFEAMRLGCNVIANDLNPVATGIQRATIEYPALYGLELVPYLQKYGQKLSSDVAKTMEPFYPFVKPNRRQREEYISEYQLSESEFEQFNVPEHDQQGLLYCREITCPYCGERTPLLNAFALSKKNDGWMVVPHIEGDKGRKKVTFVPTRLINGRGPNGEDPEQGTVIHGDGVCIHCNQTIESEEIKRQARGESKYGHWKNLLYCVVGIRLQPKKNKQNQVEREKNGEIKTEYGIWYREPEECDYNAFSLAEEELNRKWNKWEAEDIIPVEAIPIGQKTAELHNVGLKKWCDLFLPRQLLGHLYAIETLKTLVPYILNIEGEKKGTAIIHYLQYMIDKCVDFNSVQTRWQYKRASIIGSFSRHDFSLKWTFGEMTYSGANTALDWAVGNVTKAYRELCELIPSNAGKIRIINGSAANLNVDSKSVDVICMDPPYYNNVQYAELSDFYYVWEKRVFKNIYQKDFSRILTNKEDEAVANPTREGSVKKANDNYEKLMGEIFAECKRVIKDAGVMVIMFTHKTQDAWETLTRALIENGWIISSSFPVDSEAANSLHQKDLAAAASSIFLTCRKRPNYNEENIQSWRGFGNSGVVYKVREAVRDGLKQFETLKLNAVDEMVASYGCALKVLSENWPVRDGEELVTPTKAMREASTVVAQYQMERMTGGLLSATDLETEAGIVMTILGIYSTGKLPYDDLLALSRSLNVRLDNVGSHGYKVDGHMLGIGDEKKDELFFAPIIRKGSSLRIVLPQERNPKRLENPQTEWDILQGVIMAYRDGDIPVARAYLQTHAAGTEAKIIALLRVWGDNCGSNELKKETDRILYGLK